MLNILDINILYVIHSVFSSSLLFFSFNNTSSIMYLQKFYILIANLSTFS